MLISFARICRKRALHGATNACWRQQPNLMLGIVAAAVVTAHTDGLEPQSQTGSLNGKP